MVTKRIPSGGHTGMPKGGKGATSDVPAPSAAPADDPKAQAEFFMQLLDNLAQQGTPDTARMRSTLIQLIADYSAASQRGDDMGKVQAEMKVKLVGIEGGFAELLYKSTRKMRDRIVQESRRLGTSSKVGQSARGVAEGLDLVVDALGTMAQAVSEGDENKRQLARDMLDKARAVMSKLEQGAG